MNLKCVLRDSLISLLALAVAFVLSLELQQLDVEEHITTVFVFAVFVVSLLTQGYVYGLIATVVGVVAVDFAFTYPFFAFSFFEPISAISAVIMLAVATITSLLVAKIKRHESARVENERERMRANLLRAVSHDLRTPLTTICSASAMLCGDNGSLTPMQQDAMLRSIQEDAQWLTRMVENLLSVTRIDNATMKISKEPVILDELIDSAVAKFSARYPAQPVKLQLPETLVIIPMDSILIEQVLLNLLENAVFHAKGMVCLSLRVFTLGEQAVFEIIDDGSGIEENRLKNLFSGFYERQQDQAGEDKRFDGIGLSVCATIIKAHGGTITAENRKDGGTLFRFTLRKETPGDDE